MSKEAEKFYAQSKTANIPDIMQAYADKCVEEDRKRIVEVLNNRAESYRQKYIEHDGKTTPYGWIIRVNEIDELVKTVNEL